MTRASTRELVLRALAASEIAETCTEAELRRSFYALSEHWLESAADSPAEPDAPPQPSA